MKLSSLFTLISGQNSYLWQIWSLRVCEVWLPLIFLSSVGSFLSFCSLGAPSAHRDLAPFPAQICVPGFDLPLVFPKSAPLERPAPVLLLPLMAACAGRCSGFDFCSQCLARNCQICFHHFVQAAALARAAICSCHLVSVPLHLLFPVTVFRLVRSRFSVLIICCRCVLDLLAAWCLHYIVIRFCYCRLVFVFASQGAGG
jgi:hypothetical protein